ncbi:MAG: hypothetical protein GX256_07905, partial [Fretibacterium sp.]|nr:hypothetical protein [Fretibacterium sp.]
MRILQVSVKNLGAFRGERHFDCSAPEPGVLEMGLEEADFLTLFHAVCLAFYGRLFPGQGTLEDLAPSAEESSASVLFTVDGDEKPHTALWLCGAEGQERCLLDERPEKDGARRLLKLPFETFVRVFFLSPEGTSALLDEDAMSRPETFERLAGTEIYKEGLALALTPPASDEKGAPTGSRELALKVKRARSLEQELRRLEEQEAWRTALSDAQRELALLEQERQDFEMESALAADDTRRWEEGRRTLSLGSFYASLAQLRDEQEADKRSQFSLLSDIPRAQARLKSAEEALELAEAYLRDKLIAQKKLKESVRAVRELDSCIEKKKEQIFELMENVRELDIRERELGAKSEAQREAIEKLGVELRGLRKYTQSNAADEKLLQELGGIRKCFSLFLAAQERRLELKAAYSEALQKKQQAQTALNDRQALFSEMAVQFASVEKRFQMAQDVFDSSLKGKAPEEWREALAAQKEKLGQAEKLQEKLKQQLLKLQDLDGAQNRRLALEGEKKELSLKEVELGEQMLQEKEEVRLLANRFALMQLTASFDEARKILQDETPCPLCGALAHPYVVNRIFDTDDVGLKLAQAREQQEKTQALVASLCARMSDLSQETLSLSQTEARIREELQPLEQEISHLTASLNLKFAVGVPPLEELKYFHQRLRETFQRTQETVLALSVAEEDLRAAREELERAQNNQEELTRFHQEALFHLKAEQGKADALERELRGHEESLNNIRRDLTGQIAFFGYKHLPDDRSEGVLDALEERAATWNNRTERKQELEQEEFLITEQLKALQREQVQLKTEIQAQRELLKRAEADCGAFQHQRTGLFEARNPDQEETRMQVAVEKARQQAQERRSTRGEVQSTLDTLTKRQHELETALAVRRDRIQQEEIAFGKKLLASDFKNEDDYLSACLSEKERRELQERLQER